MSPIVEFKSRPKTPINVRDTMDFMWTNITTISNTIQNKKSTVMVQTKI